MARLLEPGTLSAGVVLLGWLLVISGIAQGLSLIGAQGLRIRR
jgi:hypothetical protein